MSSPATDTSASLTGLDKAVQGHLDLLEDRLGLLSKQLRQAQKLAAMGTMSAMLAHEFNNLLTPVVSYGQYALSKNDPELMRSALHKTLSQTDKISTLCGRVLGMAADQDLGPTATVLKQVVDEAVACLGRDLCKDNITLLIDIDPDLKVRANANQLQQVLFNLVLNARQAMLGRPGRLNITAQRDEQQVKLKVQDTGVGISSDDLPHIFEPFFTTKRHADRPDKRGIGLGLVVCRDIVVDHDGAIEAESELGAGTTFTVTLPAAD